MARARFGPESRLRRRREFLAVQGAGQKIHLRHFLVFVVHDAAGSRPPRIGITVTKKIGNAVVRNGIKRRVREAFRHHQGRFAAGTRLVFVAKRQAVGATYRDIVEDVQRLARKLSSAVTEGARA